MILETVVISFPYSMTATVHLLRHAEGIHNLSTDNHSCRDPILTPAGQQQCHELALRSFGENDIQLVVASPMIRTIETARLVFGDLLLKRGLKIVALPELQEFSDSPCDIGSSPDDLAQLFARERVDLHFVSNGWNSKANAWAPRVPAIEARAQKVRQWLHERPEKEIVVVTHGELRARSTITEGTDGHQAAFCTF